MNARARTTGVRAFRPLGIVRAMPMKIERAAARTGWRVFSAPDGFEVAVAVETVARMEAFGRLSEPREWYGLLVGRTCEDARGSHVLVVGVVPDPDAKATRHTVRSTLESEAGLRATARIHFPDAVPVGWVHGHVGHGADYSSVDRRNQSTWRDASAIGIVVDPWSLPMLGVYRGPESERLQEQASSYACPESEAHRNPAKALSVAVPSDRDARETRPVPVAPAHSRASSSYPRRSRIVAGAVCAFGLVLLLAWRVGVGDGSSAVPAASSRTDDRSLSAAIAAEPNSPGSAPLDSGPATSRDPDAAVNLADREALACGASDPFGLTAPQGSVVRGQSPTIWPRRRVAAASRPRRAHADR